MAGDNAIDGETDPLALDDSAIDGAVDDLRGVLKKDAGEEPAFAEESVDGMSGAPAFGSDFGAEFADADASAGEESPFGPDGVEDFGAGAFGGDFGAADGLDAPGLGDVALPTSDFGGAALPTSDFGAETAGPAIGASGKTSRADLVMGIPIDVQIILGSSRMAVSSLMELSEGATIALDRKIGEPVEIMVNGKLIGRGEITVLDSDETRFAVKIIEVIGEQKNKKSE